MNNGTDQYYTAKIENGALYGIGIVTPVNTQHLYDQLIVAVASAFHYGSTDFAQLLQKREPRYVDAPPIQQNTTSATAYFVPRAELVPIAQAIMQDAGVSDYKIMPPANGADDAGIFWKYSDGGEGGLLILKPSSGATLGDVANHLLGISAKSCQGEFGSKKSKSRFDRGSEVIDVDAICRTGGSAVGQKFTFMQMPDGGIVEISNFFHINETSAEPPVGLGARGLEDAVLRIDPKLYPK